MTDIPARSDRPKVKALEWVKDDPDFGLNGQHAATPFGEYFLFKDNEDGLFRWGNLVTLYDRDGGVRDEFKEESDAKAAAQADYERRILSALEADQ